MRRSGRPWYPGARSPGPRRTRPRPRSSSRVRARRGCRPWTRAWSPARCRLPARRRTPLPRRRREGRLSHALEAADECLACFGLGEVADPLDRPADQLAEEVLEFLLGVDLQQFGRKLHLLGLVEPPAGLFAQELTEELLLALLGLPFAGRVLVRVLVARHGMVLSFLGEVCTYSESCRRWLVGERHDGVAGADRA